MNIHMKTSSIRTQRLWVLLGWLVAGAPVVAQVPAGGAAQPSVGQQPTGAAASGQQPGAQQPAATGAVLPGGGVAVPSQPGTLPGRTNAQTALPAGPVNLQPGTVSTMNSGLTPAPTGLKPTAQNTGGQPFTLQEAIDFAVRQNVSVRNTLLDAVGAEARIREVKASALPQVAISGSFTDNLIIQRAFLPAQFFDRNAPADAPAVPVQFGVKYAGNAAASVSQVLYSASLNVGLRAAATYRELAQRTTAATKVAVVRWASSRYVAAARKPTFRLALYST